MLGGAACKYKRVQARLEPVIDNLPAPTDIPPVQGSANPHLPLFGPARASAHGGNWEVWTLPLSGGDARVRTAIGEFRPRIAWSPDGEQIAINADLGLYVVDLSQNKDSLFDIYTGTGIVWTK